MKSSKSRLKKPTKHRTTATQTKTRPPLKGGTNILQHWNNAFDAIPDLIFIQDKNFVILKANKAFYRKYRLSPKNLIGKKCHEVLYRRHQPCQTCPFKVTLKDRKPHTRELSDPKNGFPLLVTTAPLFDKSRKFIGSVNIAKDITKLKKSEKALIDAKTRLEKHSLELAQANESINKLCKTLEEQNKKLQQLYLLKSDFVSAVSHELRTPLTAIKESVNIVHEGLVGSVNEEQKKFLQTAKNNVDRLSTLINNVLDFQKLEMGKTPFQMRVSNLNELLHELAQSFKPLLQQKQLDLKLELDERVPTFTFDRDKIRQVLAQLIHNAIRFTAHGTITLTTRPHEGWAEIIVSDTGEGINQNDLPKIFEKFVQVGKDRKVGGTGLGLIICKKIIAQHQGKIWAESEPGKGAQFHVSLPIK